jgi:hypothetical protein
VPGIEEQRHVRAGELDAELAHQPLHGPLVEITPLDHLEAQPLQGGRQVGGIVARVVEGGGVLVGGVADHQRHPLLGPRLPTRRQHNQRHQQNHHPPHGTLRNMGHSSATI